MTCPEQPLRAFVRALLPALACALFVLAEPAQAFTPALKHGGESTPLNTSTPSGGAHQSSSGPSLVRTIVGLLIVIAVIWGLTWILRQVKSGRSPRAAGSGLTSLASLPLGSGRSVHLVQAGNEYLVIGSAEHGVVPIHRYSEQEARDAGLLDMLGPNEDDDRPFDRAQGWSFREGGNTRRRSTSSSTTAGALLDRLRGWTVRR
ncbi:MAG TPA: flagellar biosynthetic protein FliO [Solirubrobacteraceae bacterium]|nr:flagellar biosynthetic protein FliO [Solirubrobacteraceae bacterium]